MYPTVLTDLLGALVPVALFLDLAAYGLLSSHRTITGAQAGVITVVNLTVFGLLAWLLRWARLQRQRARPVPTRSPLRRPEDWFGWVAVIAHVAAKLQYLNLVPRWDAGTYYGEVLRAISTFDLSLRSLASTFRLAGHPSHAYGMYLALGQILFPYNHYVMNIQNLVLSGFGIYCFWLLTRRLLPQLNGTIHLLLTLAFAFNPLFFGASMHTNADLPVTVFLIFVCAAFVHHRLVLFSFGGLCLVFSKEPGTMLYALMVFLLFVLYAIPRARSLRHLVFDLDTLLRFPPAPVSREPSRGPGAALNSLRVLLCAAFPLGVFYVYQSSVSVESWSSGAKVWNDSGVLCFGLNSLMIRNVLYEALLMNFSWIPTLAVLAYLARRQIWADDRDDGVKSGSKLVLRVLGYLFAVYLVLNCIYINYLNPRYVLALIPMGLLIAAFALSQMIRRPKVQFALTTLFLALSATQNWSLIDPVSRRLWGTFEIGDRELILIGGDLQGKADGMVYNTQYTAIERLYRAVNHWALARNPQPVLLFGTTHYWLLYYNLGPLRVDAKTQEYTTRHQGTAGISLVGIDGMDPNTPYDPAVYVALPWAEDVASSLQKLQKLYAIEGVHRITYGGYYVDAYQLKRRVSSAS